MKKRMESLLGIWCDALIALQIDRPDLPSLDGGILCPSCLCVHGRSADAVQPLMSMYARTRDEKYRGAAEKLIFWSRHMDNEDGSFANDVNALWQGITVFAAIAWGEALIHHGEWMSDQMRTYMRARLRKMADFLMTGFCMEHGVVNYVFSNIAALAVAGKALGEQRYSVEANRLYPACLSYLTYDGMITGESKSAAHEYTARGCGGVDVGYNVEETIPNLALYGTISGNEDALCLATTLFQNHLQLMLPDGAWDNSFGVRNNKWTYWGSRTSDGSQMGLLLLAKRDPRFAEAARRNLSLMESCTRDGLLMGGPHLADVGDCTCVHHTFTHAKSLAAVLDMGLATQYPRVDLPRDLPGVHVIKSADTHLISVGDWRATTTANDGVLVVGRHAAGGALSLLWHAAYGPIFAGSVTEYEMAEPHNMQRHRWASDSPIPMLRLAYAGGTYMSVVDPACDYRVVEEEGSVTAMSSGRMMDRCLNLDPGLARYSMRHAIAKDGVNLSAHVSENAVIDARWHLPLVVPNGARVESLGKDALIRLRGGTLMLHADRPIQNAGMAFCHTPGFRFARLYIVIAPGARANLEIRWQEMV